MLVNRFRFGFRQRGPPERQEISDADWSVLEPTAAEGEGTGRPLAEPCLTIAV